MSTVAISVQKSSRNSCVAVLPLPKQNAPNAIAQRSRRFFRSSAPAVLALPVPALIAFQLARVIRAVAEGYSDEGRLPSNCATIVESNDFHSFGEVEIMSISLEDLYPILFILVWFVVMRYVLPRFGVRT